MSDHSKIEWTDATWNPTSGCTKVSPGCDHCYIERTPPFRMARRRIGARDPVAVRRAGKKAAGRALDGRTWDEYPA